jgi:NADH-quinone oxidoreductase subunit M
MEQVLLWLAVGAPFAGFFGIIAGAPARLTAVAASFVALVCGVLLFALTGGGTAPIAGAWKVTWFELPLVGRVDFGFNVNGVSMPLLLLSVIVGFAGVLVSAPQEGRRAEFYSLLLFMIGGASAAFTSVDLMGMYVFHELALIPTFILIGRHGHGAGRGTVAMRMAVFLVLGSLIALVGIVGLLQLMPEGMRTSNLDEIRAFLSSGQLVDGVPPWIFAAFFVGFGILFGIFPFHSWAPATYAASPAAVAMVHAGVLKNFGVFVLLTVPFSMFPLSSFGEAAAVMLPVFSVMAAGNILLLGLAALRQERLDMLLGYMSLMHMGYLVLGLLADDVFTMTSVVMLMFAHGVATAALFAWANHLRSASATLWLDDLTGVGSRSPALIFAFGLAMMASIGLPGLAPFAGETMLFLNAFEKRTLLTLAAVVGVLISAVVMLRVFRKVFQLAGLVTGEPEVRSLGISGRIAAALLGATLVVFGLFPKWISGPALEAVNVFQSRTAVLKGSPEDNADRCGARTVTAVLSREENLR